MPVQHNIEIKVEEQVGHLDTAPFKKAVLVALEQQRVAESCEIVIVFSDDVTLQELNQRFRGINRPTDVLSFENDNQAPFSNGLAVFPYYLGDIVISVERAQAQADAVSASVLHELQLLVIHGVLHLLGYDHAAPEEKKRMWAAQDEVLRQLNIAIPLPE